MKNIGLLIIIAASLSIYATCNKRLDCSQTDYSFEGNVKVYPDRDSIRINDTIWLEAIVPIQLKNLLTGEMVNYSGAENLGTAIGFIELIGNKQSNEAANDFKFTVIEGQVISNPKINLIREFLFIEKNNGYSLKVAIIPKKNGIFRFSLSDAANVYTRNDKCRKAFFRFNIINTNQHLYYNEWNFGVTVSLPNSGYCFKVI